jgi:formate/nitrite transporter FocA (FNT family)
VRSPHAIVTSGEVLVNVFMGQTTAAEFGRFLLPTMIGNGVGGAFFVAVLKYGHSSRGADDENGTKAQESPTGGRNLGSAS